jgi:SAM-dependent methyltransferase
VRSPAELYDWELAHVTGRWDQDLAWYSDLAAGTGGPVLELACGTGRLTEPLGAVGLDTDPDMLAVARRRGVRHLVRADMRRFALAQRFALVALPYNSLQLLVEDDEAVACLRCAASHLAPGGVLALEVTDFQLGALRDSVGWELLARAAGVTLHGALTNDRSRRMSTYHRRFEEGGETRVDHVRLRCLNRAELEGLLERAGLQLTDATQVSEDGQRLFCVATRRVTGKIHQPASAPAASRRTLALATRERARLA